MAVDRAATLAGVSGLLASLASVLGKFATGTGTIPDLCHAVGSVHPEENVFCETVNISCRLLLFACMLGTNAIMCTLFAKALHYSSNTLRPTLTSTAVNFTCSAVFGRVLFGEVLSFMWWIGAAFVLMGLALVHSASLGNAADIEKRKVM